MALAGILENILIAFATVSFMLAFDRARDKKLRYIENRLFVIYALAGAAWSWAFGKLIVQTDPYKAYVCRSLGMIGTFASLIAVTWLLATWAGAKGWLKKYVCGFSLLGIIIFPFNVSPDATEFMPTSFGMSYKFNPSFWVTFYNIYCVLIGVNIAIIISLMFRKSTKQRIRTMGKYMLGCEIAVALGMVFDTILPVFGFAAVPGSTITQFFGTVILWFAMKFAEKTSVTSDNLSDFIFSSMKSPMLIYDDNENLRLVSESAKDSLNIKGDFKELKIDDIFEMPESMHDLNDSKMTFEAPCRLKDMYCSVEVNRVEDAFKDTLGYIVVVTDLTQKMQFIHELEIARENADRANEAKSDFLASMSHEIRTPINSVLGMNEMILRECSEPQIEEYARNIKDSGETLLGLISDVLDFSKIEAGRLEINETNYKLSSLLKSIYRTFALKADEKGLEFYVEADEYLPEELFGDEMKMKQVITNLLSNAIKYTKKGRVELRVKLDELEDDEYAVLKIIVSDTGIGIKEQDTEKLFSAFTRLEAVSNRNIEGTGLGLAIVKRIVELFNGKISVNSIYGKGSSFIVTVKQKICSNDRTGRIDFAGITVSDDNKKYKVKFTAPEAEILIVDDNLINLKVMEALLKATEVKIDTVQNGAECVEAVRNKRYDVIFLDHMMPVMDGIEAIRVMKKDSENKSSEAVVVALTANAVHGAKEMYIEEGFTDYLSKPVSGAALEDMLMRYLPEEIVQKK